MSALGTLGGYAKTLLVLYIRLQIIGLGLWGIYAALTGRWATAALVLLVPVLYVGRIVWRGYQDGTTQPEKKVAD